MDDLMSKLQSVLNDEESMKQIKELAGMLGSGLSDNAEQAAPAQPSTPTSPPPAPQENGDTPDFSQLLASLGGMMGNSGASPQSSNQGNTDNGIDIQKLMQLGTVISSANKSDKNVDLLLALRPLLKEENQVKIDRLVKIFKLFAIYPALKESGLLGGDLFGLL